MLRKIGNAIRHLIRGKYLLEESYIPHHYWVIRRNYIANDAPLPYIKALEYAAKLNGEEIKT